MNKQPERVDVTKAAILDALWHLRKEKKLDCISVREVVALAHVHRSTFYRYFTSVPDAFGAFEDRLIGEIVESASDVVARSKDTDFPSLSVEFVNALKPYAETLGLLTGPSGEPTFAGKFKARFRPIFEEAVPFFGNTIRGEYLFQLSFMIILMNISFWSEHEETCTLEDVCAISRNIMDGGIKKMHQAAEPAASAG